MLYMYICYMYICYICIYVIYVYMLYVYMLYVYMLYMHSYNLIFCHFNFSNSQWIYYFVVFRIINLFNNINICYITHI